jgi:hypothetical protein
VLVASYAGLAIHRQALGILRITRYDHCSCRVGSFAIRSGNGERTWILPQPQLMREFI